MRSVTTFGSPYPLGTKSRCRRYLGSFVRGVLIVATIGGLALVMGCGQIGTTKIDVDRSETSGANIGSTQEKAQEELVIECLRVFRVAKESSDRAYLGSDHIGLSLILHRIDRDKSVLIALLKNEDEWIRRSAAIGLGMLGDKSVIMLLVKLLKDKDRDMRCAAAEALEKLGDVSAVEPLVEALEDKDVKVRRCVIASLQKMESKSAVKACIKALRDKDTIVRQEATWALAVIGNNSAVEPLIDVIKDKDENIGVRHIAIYAVGQIGDKSAVKFLIEVWENEEANFRRKWASREYDYKSKDDPLVDMTELRDTRLGIIKALKGITGQDFGKDYDKWSEWWEQNKDK